MTDTTTNAYLPPIFGSRLAPAPAPAAQSKTAPKPELKTELKTEPKAEQKAEAARAAVQRNITQDGDSIRASDATEKPARRTRGKQRRPTKEQVTLRLDPDVIAYFKGDDPKGWQTRLNTALRQSVRDLKRQRT